MIDYFQSLDFFNFLDCLSNLVLASSHPRHTVGLCCNMTLRMVHEGFYMKTANHYFKHTFSVTHSKGAICPLVSSEKV